MLQKNSSILGIAFAGEYLLCIAQPYILACMVLCTVCIAVFCRSWSSIFCIIPCTFYLCFTLKRIYVIASCFFFCSLVFIHTSVQNTRPRLQAVHSCRSWNHPPEDLEKSYNFLVVCTSHQRSYKNLPYF